MPMSAILTNGRHFGFVGDLINFWEELLKSNVHERFGACMTI